MKITVNVDCTPLEARQFMGLPNVEPMQKAAIHGGNLKAHDHRARTLLARDHLFRLGCRSAGMNAEWLQEFLKRAAS